MAMVVVLCGLAASTVVAVAWSGVTGRHAQDQLDRSVAAVNVELGDQVDELSRAGGRVGSVMVGGPEGEPPADVFEAAATDVVAALPEVVVGVAYVEPATGADGVRTLADRVQRDGSSDFAVSTPAAGDDHLIATFEVQAVPGRWFRGMDLTRVPALREALERARIEGAPLLSDRLEQVPAAAAESRPALARSGLALVVPVYRRAVVPPLESRGGELRGWVMMLLSADDLLEQASASTGPDLDAQLFERADADARSAGSGRGGAVAEDTLVASSVRERDGRARRLAGASRSMPISVAGQRWSLVVADDEDAATAYQPVLVLVAGAALSVLLAAFVWSLATTRSTALRHAAQAAAEVRRSEAQFTALVENLPDLIVVSDDDQTITYVSPSLPRLLGWDVEEAIGTALLDVIHPDDRVGVEQALSSRQPKAPLTARVRARDGEHVWFEGTVTNLFDDPAVAGLVITGHDVTAQREVEDRLSHDATHDPLTRLPNRVIVDDRLSHALDRSIRNGSRSAAIFVDIDRFKLVNDTWGHATGDDLLREVADRVQHAAREADTVGRYGGDEFVVICEDLQSEAEALVVAERIMREVSRPAAIDGREILVGTSIGVALSSGPGESSDALISRADAAMYEAKESGRARIVIDAAPVHPTDD